MRWAARATTSSSPTRLRNRLSGGGGGDIFTFTERDAQAGWMRSDGKKMLPDLLADFVSGTRPDRPVSAIDAVRGTAANEAFTFIGAGAFSNQAGQLRADLAGGHDPHRGRHRRRRRRRPCHHRRGANDPGRRFPVLAGLLRRFPGRRGWISSCRPGRGLPRRGRRSSSAAATAGAAVPGASL